MHMGLNAKMAAAVSVGAITIIARESEFRALFRRHGNPEGHAERMKVRAFETVKELFRINNEIKKRSQQIADVGTSMPYYNMSPSYDRIKQLERSRRRLIREADRNGYFRIVTESNAEKLSRQLNK